VLDIPFSSGTLAVNSLEPDPFSAQDIQILRTVAEVLSEGFGRMRDLHKLEERNQELEQQVAERERMEQRMVNLERLRATGEMAAGISHNLNNLLTGILASATLMRDFSEDPEIQRDLDVILNAGLQAMDLVQRLNKSARPARIGPTYEVSLNERIQEAIKSASPRWKDETEAQSVSVEVVSELTEVPAIRAISTEIDEMLLNLLFNAVDALPEGGTITVGTRVVDDYVQLTVSDTGKGMDEETRHRVFEPFFTTKGDVGSGLGLFTVYGSVYRWGGTVEVDSEPGCGTTFILRLPVWKGTGTSEVADEAADSDIHVRASKILLVEDNETTCFVLDRLLSPAHSLETVRNGQQALQQFVPGIFDVALIDLWLPGMAGDQLAGELRRADPALATVLITGWVLEIDDYSSPW
jgi:signal transduction histidine kinase